MKKIAFTGDLGFSSKYFRGTYNKEDLLDKELTDYLSDTDYTVVNVEGCVAEPSYSASKPIVHANPPECAEFLKKINGNIWTIANNHIDDCGVEGIESTLDIARGNDVLTVGAGLDIDEASKPVIIENDGADIGIISLADDLTLKATTDAPGCVMWDDDKKISRMISEIKSKCRFCIVVVHTGPEFASLMPPPIRRQYKKYLKMGADIVVGHHPHVVQNYEKIGDKIIFYSLGNFIFDTDYQRLQKYTEYGVLLKLYFDKDKYRWDYKGLKIDRENVTVNAYKAPDIFTNVSKYQYLLLWPYAMKDNYKNAITAWSYLYPEEVKGFTKRQWFSYLLQRSKQTVRHRGKISGKLLSYLNLWRLGDKKIIDYIKKGE